MNTHPHNRMISALATGNGRQDRKGSCKGRMAAGSIKRSSLRARMFRVIFLLWLLANSRHKRALRINFAISAYTSAGDIGMDQRIPGRCLHRRSRCRRLGTDVPSVWRPPAELFHDKLQPPKGIPRSAQAICSSGCWLWMFPRTLRLAILICQILRPLADDCR